MRGQRAMAASGYKKCNSFSCSYERLCNSIRIIISIFLLSQYKETGCHDSHCVGSHMWPKEHRVKRPYGVPRSKEEMIPLAEDFIKQYYESKKQ